MIEKNSVNISKIKKKESNKKQLVNELKEIEEEEIKLENDRKINDKTIKTQLNKKFREEKNLEILEEDEESSDSAVVNQVTLVNHQQVQVNLIKNIMRYH